MNPLNFPVDPNYFLKRFFLIYIYIFFYTQIKSVRPHLVTFALQISNIKKQPVETSEEIKFSYKPSLHCFTNQDLEISNTDMKLQQKQAHGPNAQSYFMKRNITNNQDV